jgi:hypothetical protein
MPDIIIFILGVIVTLFTLVAVMLIGQSEARELREAGLLETRGQGPTQEARAADRSRAAGADE